MSGKATIIVRTHFTYTPAGTGIPFVSLDGALRWLADQQRARGKRHVSGRQPSKALARKMAELGVEVAV